MYLFLTGKKGADIQDVANRTSSKIISMNPGIGGKFSAMLEVSEETFVALNETHEFSKGYVAAQKEKEKKKDPPKVADQKPLIEDNPAPKKVAKKKATKKKAVKKKAGKK